MVAIMVFWAFPAHATLVKPLNIKQLASLAHYIFLGIVIHKQNEFDDQESNRPVTYWTVKKLDCIAGCTYLEDEVVFKTVADTSGYADSGNLYHVRRNFFPTYKIGQAYLFFLPKATWTGLVQPVGLSQGIIKAKIDKNGNITLPNLKSRMKLLRRGLSDNSKYKSLNSRLSKSEKDNSYDTFKNTIVDALKE